MLEDYVGAGPVRLIVLGQDQRVRNAASQVRIRHALTLGDYRNPLSDYVTMLVTTLPVQPLIELAHLRALNLIDKLYGQKPTAEEIWRDGKAGLSAVAEKLSRYSPAVPVISLGQGVQRVLALDRGTNLRDFWGYQGPRMVGDRTNFRYLGPGDNPLGRAVFPFPHVNSYRSRRTEFWRATYRAYRAFVAGHMRHL